MTAPPFPPIAPTPLQATVIADVGALTADSAEWDALVDAASQPFCAPDLLLAWWAHARPAGARLAVVLVREDTDGGALVGIAPFFVDRGPAGIVRWRPLAAQTCQHVQPFAVPGREHDVARATSEALYAHRPRPQVLSFEGIAQDSPWPGLLADAWPRRGRTRIVKTGAAAALALDLSQTDFDGWFGSKSSHFRQRLRKRRKMAFARNGAYRLADPTTAVVDIESFIRLHVSRWEDRGGSRAVPPGVAAALREAGPKLVASGRLRIWSLDLNEETISSSLIFRAGTEVGYWLSGFSTEHSELEPSKISILHVIEDAFALGADRLDLGEGAFEYKRRFADSEETLVRLAVVPPSRRLPQVALALAIPVLRCALAEHLTEETKTNLRRMLRTTR